MKTFSDGDVTLGMSKLIYLKCNVDKDRHDRYDTCEMIEDLVGRATEIEDSLEMLKCDIEFMKNPDNLRKRRISDNLIVDNTLVRDHTELTLVTSEFGDIKTKGNAKKSKKSKNTN